MNAPALVAISIPSLQMNEQELIQVLESSIYPGAKLASIKLVLGWCKAQNKDPMKRPVHIVPMNVKKAGTKDQYEWRDVIMPGIGDYRTDAARTGEYAGIGEAKYGPDKTEKLGAVDISYPEWCEISVVRLVQGVPCNFSSGRVYWKETYATAGKETAAPNAMWRKRPRGQLEKCAEAMALRRAFPEVGAQPTADELEGKTLDEGVVIDGTTGAIQRPQVPGPQSKSAAPVPPPPPARASAPEQEPGEDTGEEKTEGATTTSKPPTGGNKAEPKPISPGMANIIKKKMEQSSKTEADLSAKFGFATITAITTDRFNEVTEWSEKPAAH
jgi:phage recombination protein Bet